VKKRKGKGERKGRKRDGKKGKGRRKTKKKEKKKNELKCT
jgi:hypothetical protein